MRLRRIVLVAVALALATGAAFGYPLAQSSRPAAAHAPATESSPRILVTGAAITPVTARIGSTWAESHADARRVLTTVAGVVSESPLVSALVWVVVVLAGSAGIRQRALGVLRVRGPPLSELI